MTRRELTNRLPALGLLLAAGAAGVYFAARAGGPGAAFLAVVAVACGVGLVLYTEPASVDAVRLNLVFDAALLAIPGLLTVFFAFDSGGYFAGGPAFAAIVLIVVFVLRVTLVEDPFAGFSPRLAVAAVALGALALWILLSGIWSDATGRALVEFDRAFAYLLLLVLLGSVARSSQRLRWLAGWLLLGILVVVVTALATRLLPDRFPTSVPNIGSALAYPVSYSNAMGILCVLGMILATYFATSLREARAVRAAAAGALPILATGLYLTLSRGPVAAAAVGLAAYLVLAWPRGLLATLIAAVPTSVIAVASAYHHPALTQRNPIADMAADQGHTVALVLVLCVSAAVVARLLLAPLDDRLEQLSVPRSALAAGIAATLVVVLVVAVAADAPRRVSDQYHRFVDTAEAGPNQDVRASVFNPASRGLIDNWSVGLDAFGDKPFSGHGAGTYETYWFQHRPANQAGYPVTDGHSLYIETLAETGAVGFVLLLVVIGSILLGLLRLRRGRHRTLYSALFAAVLAWAVHAAVDWDWEVPAVTAMIFALGGATLAAHREARQHHPPRQGVRVVVGLLLLAGAIAPALLLASQRPLDASLDAVRTGDCTRAIQEATSSIDALSVRPEPYEVLGLCQAKRGRANLAVAAMANAAKRDPNNWRYAFDLATVQGAAGVDPRAELFKAHRLNPHQAEVNQVLDSFPKSGSVAWDLELIAPLGAAAKSQ